MSRDPILLLSIQVALLGAVVVVGFFYIWRVISRLETKIEELSLRECNTINTMCNMPIQSSSPVKPVAYPIYQEGGTDVEEEEEDDDDDSEDGDDIGMMRKCFTDIPIQSLLDDAAAAFMMFKGVHDMPAEKEGVVLEELEEVKEVKKPVEADVDDESSATETETETAELTKTKLRKMSVDALRDTCYSRGLSTDGTKAVLVERILASLPTAM